MFCDQEQLCENMKENALVAIKIDSQNPKAVFCEGAQRAHELLQNKGLSSMRRKISARHIIVNVAVAQLLRIRINHAL
jgi:hypothetical protein